MGANKVQSFGICHFLNLPLELRKIIYGMLLTAPYCTTLDRELCLTCPWAINLLSYDGRAWRFHLHTDILLVNKHISAEATRMLYQGNDFIILKVTGMNLWTDAIPQFEPLTQFEPFNQFKLRTHSRIDPLLEDTGTNMWFGEVPHPRNSSFPVSIQCCELELQ
jgi:hypothetical protein